MSELTEINDDIALRPVSPDDRDFLLDVYRSSREIELSLVPWDDVLKHSFVEHQFKAQSSYYTSEYPTARQYVIQLTTGEQVGRIYIEHSDATISILDLTVLPDYRNRGIGSAILSSIVAEAGASEHSVQIYVETFNPSQNFFIARGFAVTETVGVNFKLVWSPAAKT